MTTVDFVVPMLVRPTGHLSDGVTRQRQAEYSNLVVVVDVGPKQLVSKASSHGFQSRAGWRWVLFLVSLEKASYSRHVRARDGTSAKCALPSFSPVLTSGRKHVRTTVFNLVGVNNINNTGPPSRLARLQTSAAMLGSRHLVVALVAEASVIHHG